MSKEYPDEGYQQQVANKRNWLKLDSKLIFIISIPLIAIIITSQILHLYKIDGSSMQKTLFDGDIVLINKTPKNFSKLIGKNYVPKRYDMVVFKQPNFDDNAEIIKRVIALPEERLIIKHGEVTIYNKTWPKGFKLDDALPAEADIVNTTDGNVDLILQKDEIFVLGDNRLESLDSRLFGPVKLKEMIGKAFFRILPLDDLTIY